MVHAGPDAALARRFGICLERNCLVQIDYNARVTAESPLLEVVGRALSSDVLILFVSPHSVPRRLERHEWEPVFNEAAERNTRIACVSVADCPFPKVLLRNNVFDSGRALKRWIFSLDPAAERPNTVPGRAPAEVAAQDLAPLWDDLADQPGTARAPGLVAHAFAVKAEAEFEGVFWVDCRGATLAGVAGELGAQLGLRLPYELRRNLEVIHPVLNSRRCLVVLDGGEPDISSLRGRASWLLADAPALEPVTLQAAQSRLADLSAWVTSGRAVPRSGEIHRALDWLIRQPGHWLLACQFARAAIAWYNFHERFAEAFELIEMMCPVAIRRQDRDAAAEFGRDRGWILDSWGRPPEAIEPFAAVPEPARQLALW